MVMKRFALAALSVLALALAFHLGGAVAQSGQGTGPIAAVVAYGPNNSNWWIFTTDGEAYLTWEQRVRDGDPPSPVGLVWGGPVPVAPTTWGQVKAGKR